MENRTNKKVIRPWRKLVKKLQRKRKRQKLAQLRDKQLEEDELEKLKDPLYKSWREHQEMVEAQKQILADTEHQEQEELWLRRELIAQQQFKKDEFKRLAEEEEQLKKEQEFKQLEEARKIKRELLKLEAEKVAKEFDDVLTCMQNYLDDCTMTTPPRLENSVQSRLGEKSCDFFDKTNCCRYGPSCSFNHIRPMLSKIIIINHFFQHPLLEQQEHEEYARSDSELELSERDLRESYDEFCEDVWPVLEEFGAIKNFRTVRNVHFHLRGHVFVEYEEKRSALKAFINLQNRYYASKRLNVEFSTIKQWRTGVCGLSLGRKCPKGVKCSFLHLMQNKDNKYNMPIENPARTSRIATQRVLIERESSAISWNTVDAHKSTTRQKRSWCWSESPEIELKSTIADLKSEGENNRTQHINLEASSIPPSISKQQKSHKNDKNRKKSRSKSPHTRRLKKRRKSKSKSPNSRHRKKEVKSSTREKHRKRKDKSPNSRSNRHRHSKSPNAS